METFIIDRNTWLRGQFNSMLFRAKDGKMCCLGQIGLQCGLNEKDMSNKISPTNAIEHLIEFHNVNPFFISLMNKNYFLSMKAMGINDNIYTNDKYKEIQLKSLFAKYDVELKFIN